MGSRRAKPIRPWSRTNANCEYGFSQEVSSDCQVRGKRDRQDRARRGDTGSDSHSARQGCPSHRWYVIRRRSQRCAHPRCRQAEMSSQFGWFGPGYKGSGRSPDFREGSFGECSAMAICTESRTNSRRAATTLYYEFKLTDPTSDGRYREQFTFDAPNRVLISSQFPQWKPDQ